MKFNPKNVRFSTAAGTGLWLVLLLWAASLVAGDVLSPDDLLRIRSVTSASISPDGQWIAYTVSVPREADEPAGGAWSELHVVSTRSGESRPFITGKVSIRALAWKPDGSAISFLTRRNGGLTQVWMIPMAGGEAQQVTHADNHIFSYAWHPSGEKIAWLATPPKSARQRALEKKGYGFIYFEENLRHRNLYIADAGSAASEQLTKDITLWDFTFSPDGNTIAFSASPQNLIDQRYIGQSIYILNLADKSVRRLTDNPRKLGNFRFSPDGRQLAFAAALDRKDNAISQAFVIPVTGGKARNLTPPNFRGHINWVGWKDKKTLLYMAGEGTMTTLSTVKASGGKRKVILHSKDSGIVTAPPSYTRDVRHFAFVGQSPQIPRDLFYWQPGKALKRLTTVNPWLAERELGKQEVITYKASDGQAIEGILIYPVGYEKGKTYPLIVLVHGGPETHYSNGWLSRYATPGQVLAGKGYAVFHPNYRSSSGYGIEFSATGYNDAAGREFDDIADGIDHLIAIGLADKKRVGMGGGSYGGYASGWFATYYTDKVRAVCMFVGISDLISKRGTTDIPYEELYVHSGKKLEEMWQESLKRSPIYWAHQSKTATLIYGGTADTRVHPSQSLELYRRMKMNDHPAVRLVQYPGEPHGNRNQTGQRDVVYRILDWWDWYVRDLKPLDGPMPPLDISARYGIELPQ